MFKEKEKRNSKRGQERPILKKKTLPLLEGTNQSTAAIFNNLWKIFYRLKPNFDRTKILFSSTSTVVENRFDELSSPAISFELWLFNQYSIFQFDEMQIDRLSRNQKNGRRDAASFSNLFSYQQNILIRKKDSINSFNLGPLGPQHWNCQEIEMK